MNSAIIVGAGPGIGMALARKSGNEKLNVGLIARDQSRLDAQVKELSAAGITAHAQAADVLDQHALTEAILKLERIGGPTNFLFYNPTSSRDRLALPENIGVDELMHLLNYSLVGAVVATQAVLPGMLERQQGNILLTGAYSGRYPIPSHANAGIALAGLRNYAYSLNRSVAGRGIYVGTITVAGIIRYSATDSFLTREQPERRATIESVMIDPKDIAETYWDMAVRRNRVEEVVGRPDIIETWN